MQFALTALALYAVLLLGYLLVVAWRENMLTGVGAAVLGAGWALLAVCGFIALALSWRY